MTQKKFFHDCFVSFSMDANKFIDNAESNGYTMEDGEAEALAGLLSGLDAQRAFDAYMLACHAHHRAMRTNSNTCK